MRVAFVGLPLGALLLLGDGHEIVWAGLCRRGSPGQRRLTRALGEDRVRLVPDLDDEAVVRDVSARAPDLLVSWFWTRRVPAALRAVAPLGAFGVHPSLLPRHRGPDPYFWAIDRGDPVTGVTAHVLDDDYDTGAILGRSTLQVEPAWNAWTLAKRLDRPSLALLREVTAAYARGEPPIARAQEEAEATEALAPDDEDLELRWSWSAAQIERRVRAASPWPGAFTAIGDDTVVLTRVRATADHPRALVPGEACVREDGVALVRTADAAVELLGGRLEDDDGERHLDASELAALVAASDM